GAVTPPVSVNNDSTTSLMYHKNGGDWDSGDKYYTVDYDSSIWTSITHNGDQVTFVSPQYGTLVFTLSDWGNGYGINLSSSSSNVMSDFRLDYYYADGLGNNSYARTIQAGSTQAKEFWQQYGLTFNF
ncbi:MAG: hypothetical protein IJ080_06400, partial [Oscillospiraceae bacterium]|nr:hypothetical protein [Oscillospiraceae bacterium]